jgi:hypothetical protein
VPPKLLLAPSLARSQHVEADPRCDRRQPAAEVLHIARVGTAQPQPRLLHGVVGLSHRAEYPVGHRPQVGTLSLELLCQQVVLVHGHIPSSRFVIAATNAIKSM